MVRLLKIFIVAIGQILLCACSGCHSVDERYMCEKMPMQSDGIVRLSKITVNMEYLQEYMMYAVEVGTISLQTEPGVLTMYAIADKENPCKITILETYASREAYTSHIASDHFQKYKQNTLYMVDSLSIDDVIPLNRNNIIENYILPGN